VIDLESIIIVAVILAILIQVLGPPMLPFTPRWFRRRQRQRLLAEERERFAERQAELRRKVLDAPRASARRALRRAGGSDARDADRDDGAAVG
jgi:type II secretory pathway pseudopilin PulG